jgi:hypothetical protein
MNGKGLDLSGLETNAKQEGMLDILHPATQVAIGMKLRLASPDSEHYRKLVQTMKNKNMAILQRKGNKILSAEAVEESTTAVLAGAVLGFVGDPPNWGGAPLECDAETMRMVFDKFPWIREQIDEYLGDRANFFNR